MAIEEFIKKYNKDNKVILVGGSSRIPAVQEALKKFIGKELILAGALAALIFAILRHERRPKTEA